MRKMFFVSAALVLIAVGFFIGAMSNNKAYARLSAGPCNTVECVNTATGQACPMESTTVTIDKADYEKLLNECEAYKALESFWAEQALATPAPVLAESPIPLNPLYHGGPTEIN